MTAEEAFQKVTKGGGDDFARVISICEQLGEYCLIGGLAVNCYVDPVYTLDADLVIHTQMLQKIRAMLEEAGFKLEEQEHSVNARFPGSDLRIQFTKDSRYQPFVQRSETREVFGKKVKVACLKDLVQGKIWAWSDPNRRLSKRQKDQADLIRIAESNPEIRKSLPAELQKLFES
jgi:hypothetical protein